MIFVECYADEALIKAFGIPSRSIRHMHGKGNIEKRLRRLESGIGLMDEDTAGFQPRDYRPTDNLGSLILLTHGTASTKRIILIRPRLEEWLIARATANHVNLSDFGLPDSPDRLHSIPRYEQKPKFTVFLQRLKQLDSEMQRLGKWIKP